MNFDPRNIRILPLNSLLPHEKVIEEGVEKLRNEILSDGIQKDPIIVEKDTFVVLDGTHRLNALKMIGIEYAVCYLVPYSLGGIRVERWARVVSHEKKMIHHLLDALSLRQSISFENAFRLSENKGVAFFAGGSCYGKEFLSVLEAYSFVEKIEKTSKIMGWRVEYLPEDEIDIAIRKGKLVILGPRLRKQDVVEIAKRGALLPPKTTHHIIDPRPVSIRYPIEKLRAWREEPAKLINQEPKILPPESVYEGRRYKESLIVLNER